MFYKKAVLGRADEYEQILRQSLVADETKNKKIVIAMTDFSLIYVLIFSSSVFIFC